MYWMISYTFATYSEGKWCWRRILNLEHFVRQTFACKRSHQYSWSVFHTPVYKHTFSWSVDKREDSPAAQWERHCDRTQFKQDAFMLFEEYRVYESCFSEISKAHFCINLRTSVCCLHACSTNSLPNQLQYINIHKIMQVKTIWKIID